MKRIAPLFIIGCFWIGYFGVQKFEPKKMFVLGGGLIASGAIGLALQSIQPKPKSEPTPKRNVTSL